MTGNPAGRASYTRLAEMQAFFISVVLCRSYAAKATSARRAHMRV
jgi:hypothetical protein